MFLWADLPYMETHQMSNKLTFFVDVNMIRATARENQQFAYAKKKTLITAQLSDQRLCFRYMDSTVPLLLLCKGSSF